MATSKNAAVAASTENDDWQARSDLHTLTEAHRIRSDPKRHAAVKRHASNQMKVLKSMAVDGPAKKPNNPLY